MNYGSSFNFEVIFEALPSAYLIIDPEFIIIAATDLYLKTSRTNREAITGRYLFDVFPDNPEDPEATGVADLTRSLEKVMKTKTADVMPTLRYDIPSVKDKNIFETKYWRVVNSPILDKNGELIYLANCVTEITHMVDVLSEAMDNIKKSAD